MKVLTVVTPPHQLYLEKHFLPTFPWDEGIDLIIRRLPHVCPSGQFMSPGFNEICRLKMQAINELCNRFANQIIFYCDVDVRFYTNTLYENVLKAIEDNHMAFINDGNNQYGCGVIAVQASHPVREFLSVLDGMIPEYRDDQEALNFHIREFDNLEHNFLPDSFFGIGKDFGYWPRKPEDKPIVLPENMVLHHGNFATGIKNKLELMEHVRGLWSASNEDTQAPIPTNG